MKCMITLHDHATNIFSDLLMIMVVFCSYTMLFSNVFHLKLKEPVSRRKWRHSVDKSHNSHTIPRKSLTQDHPRTSVVLSAPGSTASLPPNKCSQMIAPKGEPRMRSPTMKVVDFHSQATNFFFPKKEDLSKATDLL